jgi:superfamily II DNA/RNA helicase
MDSLQQSLTQESEPEVGQPDQEPEQVPDPEPEPEQEPESTVIHVVTAPDKRIVEFTDMDLPMRVLQCLNGCGFEHPSIIQSQTIPIMREGRDLIAQGQSGTGKTTAFAAAIVCKLLPLTTPITAPQAIVLATTRELAEQIVSVFKTFFGSLKIEICLCIGGRSDRAAMCQSANNAHVLVGTLGRMTDLLEIRKTQNGDYYQSVKSGDIRIIIFDEADKLFGETDRSDSTRSSNLKQITDILASCPEKAQICAFSATFTAAAKDAIRRMCFPTKPPEEVMIQGDCNMTVKSIAQYYVEFADANGRLPAQSRQSPDQIQESMRDKARAVGNLIDLAPVGSIVIFTNSIERLLIVEQELLQSGLTSIVVIHAKLTVEQRSANIQAFRNRTKRILLASDVISRGIDVQHVSCVIQLEPPKEDVVYIHRVGRCGRMGRKGVAVTFVENAFELEQLHTWRDRYVIDLLPLPEDPRRIFSWH